MKVYCSNGIVTKNYHIEKRNGVEYIYSFYMEDHERKKCYVGPVEPQNVLTSLPLAYLIKPIEWSSALKTAFERLIDNMDGNMNQLNSLESMLKSVIDKIEEKKKEIKEEEKEEKSGEEKKSENEEKEEKEEKGGTISG